MADQDEIILEDAKEAAFSLDKRLRRAVLRGAPLSERRELKRQAEAAFKAYSKARLKLLQEGTLASNTDVGQMRRIRAEIDQAADTQQIARGVLRLVQLLGRFA